MQEGQQQVRCSGCGAEGLREDMFGAEPDLLCERCADVVRTRTAKTPTGRMMNAFGSGKAPFTVGLIGVTIVIFLAGGLMKGNPTGWALWIRYLTIIGISPDGYITATVAQQPWRLITSALLHAGFFHILFNLWWIWDLGRAIEWRRGTWTMAALVLGSAAIASAAQWIFAGGTDGRPHWPGGVGLSGVVFGLAGFLYAQRRDDPLAAAIMNPRTTRMLAAWFVLCIVLTELKLFPIGNWAHGGGAVWGLAAGFAARAEKRALWLPVLALATGGVIALVMRGTVFW